MSVFPSQRKRKTFRDTFSITENSKTKKFIVRFDLRPKLETVCFLNKNQVTTQEIEKEKNKIFKISPIRNS